MSSSGRTYGVRDMPQELTPEKKIQDTLRLVWSYRDTVTGRRLVKRCIIILRAYKKGSGSFTPEQIEELERTYGN